MIYLHFDTEAPLLRAVTAPALCELLRAPPTGVYAGLAAFSRRFYGPDSVLPDQPMTAGFSYVVRYHRPAEDEAAFVAHYVAHHPPLLAMLPAIRAVLCYFPLSEVPVPEGLARPDYMIGNEVVFETIEAFNDAMASALTRGDAPGFSQLSALYRPRHPFPDGSPPRPMKPLTAPSVRRARAGRRRRAGAAESSARV